MSDNTRPGTGLFSACLDLMRHAEGRRVEVKYLMIAVGRLIDYVVTELRDGDHVTVDGRNYVVQFMPVGSDTRKVLVVNNGILGERNLGARRYASLEDNTIFASHAERVVDAFAMTLEEHRKHLSNMHAKLQLLLNKVPNEDYAKDGTGGTSVKR